MNSASRSGRVTIAAGSQKTVIAGNLTGAKTAIYRFFNSGKEGEGITIESEDGTFSVPCAWKDSVDVPVKQKAIVVKAGSSKEAEVVYDFLGLA